NPYPFFVSALIAIRWNDYIRPVSTDEIERRLRILRWKVQAMERSRADVGAVALAQASSYGLESLWLAIRGDNFKAGRAGGRMYRELGVLRDLGANCPWVDYLYGNYDYFAGTAPRLIQILGSVLGIPPGDRTRGIRRLQQAATVPSVVQWEAVRTLVYIYLFYEHDYDRALEWGRRLVDAYPENLTHRLFLLRAAVHGRRWAEAEALWQDWVAWAIIRGSEIPEITWTEAVYWRARWYMHTGQWETAESWLRHLLAMSQARPPWLDAWARLSLAQVLDTRGAMAEAERIYRALFRGPDVRDFHRLIRRRLQKGWPIPLEWTNY
ncbi:MAG: hypothetical protein NZ742_10220, partial [Acidobacteria bacterium]|nr:hypothetical protein [Acidobacteriota bacterium]MDW7984408.1 hypothetical protein [Acidobacteriota bacterium]